MKTTITASTITTPSPAKVVFISSISVHQQVLAENDKNPTVRARLAAAYYNLGNFPDDAAGYRKLVEEYPGELDYQTGLGWAVLRLGRREES